MYSIHYVVSRENDQPIYKETPAATGLDEAKAHAASRIKNSNIAGPADPAQPHPTGFLIYDAAGSQLLHREYLG
jgi:hypothetical protein